MRFVTFTSAISAPSNQQDLYLISSLLIACVVFDAIAAAPTLSIVSNPRQSAVETKLLFTHVSITAEGGERYRLNKARRASLCHGGAHPYVDTLATRGQLCDPFNKAAAPGFHVCAQSFVFVSSRMRDSTRS